MKSLFYATMVCLMIATFAFGEVHPYGKRVKIAFDQEVAFADIQLRYLGYHPKTSHLVFEVTTGEKQARFEYVSSGALRMYETFNVDNQKYVYEMGGTLRPDFIEIKIWPYEIYKDERTKAHEEYTRQRISKGLKPLPPFYIFND